MPLPQKLNVQKAIQQKMQGMNNSEIAKSQNVSRNTVSRMLKPILEQLADPETIEYYRKEQAQILDGLAAKTVAAISDDKLENASFRDLCVGAGILIDKSRLIQGQSTSNSSIMLKAVLGSLGGDADEISEHGNEG
jgi:predicted DNA-binding protein YlxM (UPF0122 family)